MIQIEPGYTFPYPDMNANNPFIGWRKFDGLYTASSSAQQYPASNMKTSNTAEYWQAADSSVTEVFFAAPFFAGTFDYFAIGAHNLRFSTITLEHQNSGDASWTPLFTNLFVLDGQPIIQVFQPISPDVFRLTITPAPGVIPKIGMLNVGDALWLHRRIYVGHTPVTLAKKVQVSSLMSENSEFLGRVVRSQKFESSFEQKHVTPSQYRDDILPWSYHARTEPWFFAWRPESYASETALCWTMKDIIPSNQLPNGMMEYDVDFTARAGADSIPFNA